ncbi:outer membrane beta-barrel protein [Tianweitania sp. BSSL-BM11]|uniref:Outer membrane beta-barrel protein n=1 Tax=Tianweitania aestuarii TaxID=2814886 RepID=A0ABS5RXI3_9HYPH|nr:outer membrane beta-barrel protein [Tianweitania aestuarii]MBS9721022.1 outer membrane beta-barrel protein [Tianweitania aestuarii]
MSQALTLKHIKARRRRALVLASFTAISTMSLAAPAFAQSTGLRTGTPANTAGTSTATRTALEEIAQAPVYQPTSEGALPDDSQSSSDNSANSTSIFDDTGPSDPFANTAPDLRTTPASPAGAADPALPSGSLTGRAATAVTAQTPEGTSGEAITALPAERQGRFNTDALDTLDTLGRSERAAAIEARRRTFEETPFAAVGLRAGTFLLFPTLEQGITATNNADSSTNGDSAVLSETTLRLNANSDWARHSAYLSGFGTYRKTISGDEVETVYGGLNSGLQLDLANAYTLNATANYLVTPESATSPVQIEGTLDEPIRQSIDGSLGLSKNFGPLQLTGTGRIERDIYGDADLSTGGTISQKDRNSTLAAFVLRTGWELSPALTPFVEAEIGKRFYDNKLDSAGYRRSGVRSGIRGGLEIDIAEKWAGELSAGWIAESFDDDRLRTLSGATFDADLTWSPMRGTTVVLNGNTTVEATTSPGDSGSILYSAALSATRELRANLTGNASIGLGIRDFKDLDSRELIWNTEASLTYWFNRYAGLTGRVRYEQIDSDLAFRDMDATSVFLGIKLQR